MRTIIDLPERDLRTLAVLGEERGVSRAEIIRQAVRIFLEMHKAQSNKAFGLWSERTEDGIAYQRALRAEWGE